MNLPVFAALVGWACLVPVLFRFLPARRAVLASFVCGWLFLPVVRYRIEGMPDVTKTAVTCLVIAAAVAVFDRKSVRAPRLRWFDVPMLVWCACPLASSIANALGLYDGLSASFDQTVAWGIPYAIGRIYFSDPSALSDLAAAIVVGGLVYVPLCVFEMIMGPDLHAIFYGYDQASLHQAARYGGWRPVVFLNAGLMVAFWMSAATLAAGWLWRTRSVERFGRLPIGWCFVALLVTTLALKSVNAWFHLVAGGGVLAAVGRARGRLPLFFLLLLPMTYASVRVGGSWDGRGLPQAVAWTVGDAAEERVQFRIRNDNLVLEKSRERPIFGWGRWSRSHTYLDETTGTMTVVDSLWVEAFGECGGVGLAALLVAHLLPSALYWRRSSLAFWSRPAGAPGAVLAVVVALFAIDNCMNAMINPMYLLAAGGLVGFGGVGWNPLDPPLPSGKGTCKENKGTSSGPL